MAASLTEEEMAALLETKRDEAVAAAAKVAAEAAAAKAAAEAADTSAAAAMAATAATGATPQLPWRSSCVTSLQSHRMVSCARQWLKTASLQASSDQPCH